MQGYKTIIVGILALIWSILGAVGVDVPANEQATIGSGLLAIIMLVLRFFTKTPIATKE